MSRNKRATRTISDKTDWARVDAHVITPEEYAEIPELTDEDFKRMRPGSTFHPRAKTVAPTKRGRPLAGKTPKRLVTLRLDEGVIEAYRATGKGWQSRMGAILERAAKRERQRPAHGKK